MQAKTLPVCPVWCCPYTFSYQGQASGDQWSQSVKMEKSFWFVRDLIK